MTGEQLYEAYRSAHLALNNCHCPPWAEVEEDDQAAWNYVAFYNLPREG